MTMNLDLLIDLSTGSLEHFVRTIERIGYKSRTPKKKWYKLAAIGFQHQKEKDKQIDVFRRNPIKFTPAYRKRKVFRVEGLKISCVSLEALMVLKRKADWIRGWVDLGALKQIKEMRRKK